MDLFSGSGTTSSESEDEDLTQKGPDASKSTSATEKEPSGGIENNVDVGIDTLTGTKDIPYCHESPFSSDRGLYFETIDDEQLKDLLAKQGPCQPTEDQLSFNTDFRGRKFSSTRYFITTPMGINKS